MYATVGEEMRIVLGGGGAEVTFCFDHNEREMSHLVAKMMYDNGTFLWNLFSIT